jgi:hypothetical protein
MGRKAKHRYSQAEEDLIWSHYTPEEKAEHNKFVMGYGEFTANTQFIDALRSEVMTRKEQDGRV